MTELDKALDEQQRLMWQAAIANKDNPLGYRILDAHMAAIKAAIATYVVGEDSPLNPTPDAIGHPGVDPKQWREWSIVENHLRATQRRLLEGGE